VLDFPAWDCLPYDRVSPNPEISARRMATLAVLADGLPGPFVLLTTLNAATQKVPAREVVRAASFRAAVGERVDEARLKGFLARMGFSPVSTVAEPGRLCAARRDRRHLSAGAGWADPAGFLRRCAGRRAAL
jgi:transcription-repair coupling factor (superfamily II helicase)